MAENTNGIVTVNGHSYSDPSLRTENTNFALLVSNNFTEPFRNSNEYGESIARLSNMLGGGVLVVHELVHGCCSYGAHFTGPEDIANTRARAERLTASRWELVLTGVDEFMARHGESLNRSQRPATHQAITAAGS